MLHYDKIKLKTRNDYLLEISPLFKEIKRNEKIERYLFDMQSPFYLYINNDIKKGELIIEFTGKILLSNYYRLISIDTIEECLVNVEKIAKCKLNVDGIVKHSEVLSVDVTKDITAPEFLFNDKVKGMFTYLNQNSRQWNIEKYNKQGITITKRVKSKELKNRMIIYDTYAELRKSENKPFLGYLSYDDRNALLEYFKGKIRIEININSFKQMRELLHIQHLSLTDVLTANSNPFGKLMRQIVDMELLSTDSLTICSIPLKELNQYLILKSCNFDIEKVRALLRPKYSPNTNMRKILLPYKKLLLKEQNFEDKDRVYFQELMNQIVEV